MAFQQPSKIVRWNSRGLSLWGRLEVVKADLLPSLNYLAFKFFQFLFGLGES